MAACRPDDGRTTAGVTTKVDAGLEARGIARLAPAGWAIDEGDMQFGPGDAGSVDPRTGGRTELLSDGIDDCEVLGLGDGPEPFALGLGDSSCP